MPLLVTSPFLREVTAKHYMGYIDACHVAYEGLAPKRKKEVASKQTEP